MEAENAVAKLRKGLRAIRTAHASTRGLHDAACIAIEVEISRKLGQSHPNVDNMENERNASCAMSDESRIPQGLKVFVRLSCSTSP